MQILNFNSASEFLDELKLTNKRWGHQLGYRWIFRGHYDADWMLLPGAFRPSGIERLLLYSQKYEHRIQEKVEILRERARGRSGNVYEPDTENLLKAGLIWLGYKIMLREFGRLASVNGFIPWEPRFGLNNFDVPYEWDAMLFGFSGLQPDDLTTTAQHYGLPTDLLDWTYDPKNAAFFACANLQAQTPTDMAVWAIDTYFEPEKELDNRRFIGLWYGNPASNERLKSQRGVFTVDGLALDEFIRTGQFRDISQKYLDSDFSHRIIKFVLAGSERNKLIELLWREGVTWTALFPELRSCVCDIELLPTLPSYGKSSPS